MDFCCGMVYNCLNHLPRSGRTEKSMNKHRTNVFISLVLVLLIIAAVSAWATGSSILSSAPSVSEKPEVSDNAVAAVTPTPQPTAVPSAQPTPTPEPTPVGSTRTLSESGSFSSNTGTKLNMQVNWSVTSANDKELTLQLDLVLYSYTLSVGPHNGVVRVNGTDHIFTSPGISYKNEKYMNAAPLTSITVTVPAELGETVSIPVEASWDFYGTYGGKDIGRITAAETITIQG